MKTFDTTYPRLCLMVFGEEIIRLTCQRLINNCKRRKGEMIQKYFGEEIKSKIFCMN